MKWPQPSWLGQSRDSNLGLPVSKAHSFFFFSPLYLFFNWRIIVLQNFDVYCQTKAHSLHFTPGGLKTKAPRLEIPCPRQWGHSGDTGQPYPWKQKRGIPGLAAKPETASELPQSHQMKTSKSERRLGLVLLEKETTDPSYKSNQSDFWGAEPEHRVCLPLKQEILYSGDASSLSLPPQTNHPASWRPGCLICGTKIMIPTTFTGFQGRK